MNSNHQRKNPLSPRAEFNGRVKALSEALKGYCAGGICGFTPHRGILEDFHDLLNGIMTAPRKEWVEWSAQLKLLNDELHEDVVNFLNARKRDIEQDLDRLRGSVQSFPQWKDIAEQAVRAADPFLERIRRSQGRNRYHLNTVQAAFEYRMALVTIEQKRGEIDSLKAKHGARILAERTQAEFEAEYGEILSGLKTGWGTLEQASASSC